MEALRVGHTVDLATEKTTRRSKFYQKMDSDLSFRNRTFYKQETENASQDNDTDVNLVLENINYMHFQYHLPAIIYTSVLMFIGTPGNAIVLYVYFFKWRKSTSRMFILFLTSLDMINCVTTLPMEIYIMRYPITLDKPALCKVSRFATYVMNSSSAAILVAIAVDRFRRICQPHGPQFSAKKSQFICIGCILLALCLTWPSLVFYGTRIIYVQNIEGKTCLLENKYDSSIYPYVFFVLQMAATLVIFTTLSILYYFVGIQVYKYRKKRLQRRKARASAKSLLEAEITSHSRDNTLLQESDSQELKKEKQKQQTDNDHSIEDIEMKPLNKQKETERKSSSLSMLTGTNEGKTKELKVPSMKPYLSISFNEISAIDSSNTSQSGSRGKITKSKSCENCNGVGSCDVKRKRTHKNGFAKRRGTLKDSLTRVNEHCMQMKLKIGRSTLMLFLITLAYIISFLPFYVIAIVRQTSPDYVNTLQGTGYRMYLVCLRSYLLSSAINPIIYSFCNAQFRAFCLGMFQTGKNRKTNL